MIPAAHAAGVGEARLGCSEFCAGDRLTLEEAYRSLYLRLVRRVTRRYRLSKEDASDVVHDAFVLALAKLTGERNAAGWLYRTVDNLAVNRKRKDCRRARLMAQWGPSESLNAEREEPES